MARVKRGVKRRIKREKVLGQAKGYWGAKSSNYRTAKEAVEKSLLYAYRDRRAKKRDFRRLWIIRVKAGAMANGLTYSRFIQGLRRWAAPWTARSWRKWPSMLRKRSAGSSSRSKTLA